MYKVLVELDIDFKTEKEAVEFIELNYEDQVTKIVKVKDQNNE